MSQIDGTGRDRPDLAHSDPPFEINRDFAFWDDYAFYGDDGEFFVSQTSRHQAVGR